MLWTGVTSSASAGNEVTKLLTEIRPEDCAGLRIPRAALQGSSEPAHDEWRGLGLGAWGLGLGAWGLGLGAWGLGLGAWGLGLGAWK